MEKLGDRNSHRSGLPARVPCDRRYLTVLRQV